MDAVTLRRDLLELLGGGNAHIRLDDALAGLAPADRHRRASGLPHSVWELLEHMRLAQEDIVRYTLDAGWVSPPFPDGYWPTRPPGPIASSVWSATLEGFRSDLARVVSLVEDDSRVLSERLPHGEGRTYLRQVLLVADHNAYHLGQIVTVRRALAAWG